MFLSIRVVLIECTVATFHSYELTGSTDKYAYLIGRYPSSTRKKYNNK